MKRVLLHICCGPCSFYSIEKLKEEGFYIEGLFFNPNIHPFDEYLKRKSEVQEVGRFEDIKIIEDRYEPSLWFNICGDYKEAKEGGQRCFLCYQLRLKETFQILKEKKFDYFTTTLTISPHKNSQAIIDIGKSIGGDSFLPIDFKKNDGFKLTVELAKKHNLYRQNYCGCAYSLRDESARC